MNRREKLLSLLKTKDDAGNKKRSILLMIFTCVVSMQLTACSIGEGKAVVTCDGYEVKLGKATVAELKEAGFNNRYSHIDEKMIDSMSWETFYAMKGDNSYGDMLAGNKKSSQVEFDKGVIFEIILTYDDPDYSMGEVLVNGVNFEGYTREKVKEAMGDAKITLDSDTYLSFELSGCNYTFSFENGSEILTTIRVNDGTEKEYNFN